MKRIIFLLSTACCLLGQTIAGNVLTVADVNVTQSGQATLEIGCNFDTEYTAFMLEVSLPEGLSLLTDEDGYPIIDKAFDTNHILTGKLLQSNGNYRFTCCSMDNISIPTTGVLFRVTVMADASLPLGANLAAGITACEFTRTSDSNGENLDDVDFNIYIYDLYALGDVNRDGSVDIGDIVMTINVMTGSETDADIMAAADVNSDDCVDIGDIVAIIDIMTSSPAAARAQRAPAATDADDYIEATATGNDIVVGLNNQHAFTAFQMVLTLPAGCTLNEVLIDSKRGSRHIADVKTLANGSYLVMGYSLNNKLLKSNEGLLFTISTAGTQPTGAVISDVLFATAEGGTYRLAGIEVGTAGTTGINAVNGRTETADPVYDLNGRRRVAKAKDALLPGLYIINGKKTVIK